MGGASVVFLSAGSSTERRPRPESMLIRGKRNNLALPGRLISKLLAGPVHGESQQHNEGGHKDRMIPGAPKTVSNGAMRKERRDMGLSPTQMCVGRLFRNATPTNKNPDLLGKKILREILAWYKYTFLKSARKARPPWKSGSKMQFRRGFFLFQETPPDYESRRKYCSKL
jgi:hypothetical protein